MENCSAAADLPPNWLDLLKNWPTPPDTLDPDAWRAWLEQCNIPADEPPPDWPELPPPEDWVTSPDQLPPPPDDWTPPDDWPGN